MKKLFILFLAAYASTSFQVNDTVSISLNEPKLSEKREDITIRKFYSKDTLSCVAGKKYNIDCGQPYTAIKITEVINNRTSIAFLSVNDSLYFGSLETLDDLEISPGFAIFSKPTATIEITTNKTTRIIIELFYAPPVAIDFTSLQNKKSGCEKPITISQTLWRDGLPQPVAGRKSVNVKHCIIHHSAGSNTDTNFVNTIRNIYLYHTQSNGWDDIGYNYVIAQNGVIFDGRDPQGIADQDNTQGAHFCGKNGETMGICLLGNYDLVPPSAELTKSLRQLLVWKLHKEYLSAFATFPHPDINSPSLGTIALHQNGCATACPGENVRLILDALKSEVQGELNICNGVTAVLDTKKYKQLVYPNPSNGQFYALIEKNANIKSYRILSLAGKVLTTQPYSTSGYIHINLPNGEYILELWNSKSPVVKQKIIILNP